MKKLMLVMVFLLAAAGARAEDKTWHTGKAVQTEIGARGTVWLALSSGDATVTINSSAKEIVVTPESQEEADLAKFKIQVRTTGAQTIVKISGPHNHARYSVELPPVAKLEAKMSAGDLLIKGLASDADISLHAGDMNIELAASAQDFGPVDLSVKVGDLNARMFNADKGGFFRHFHDTEKRKYALKAHVGTGDLTVK